MTATTAQISVKEYLRTSYRPDRDYGNGEIQERNLGELNHATVQANLTIYLGIRRREWNILVMTELRIRVAPARVRIPDICVLLPSAPYEPVLTVPPFLCIKVLSPSDNLLLVHNHIAEFIAFGVPCIWLINTKTRQVWIHTSEGASETQDGILRAAHIEVPLPEIFE